MVTDVLAEDRGILGDHYSVCHRGLPQAKPGGGRLRAGAEEAQRLGGSRRSVWLHSEGTAGGEKGFPRALAARQSHLVGMAVSVQQLWIVSAGRLWVPSQHPVWHAF